MDKATISNRLPESIKYLGKGGRVLDNHPFKCLVCGHKWLTRPNNIFNGSGCPQCFNEQRVAKPNGAKTDSEYRAEVNRMYGSSYKPVRPYVDAKTPILHKCSKGHIAERKPNYVLSHSAIPCVQCSYEARGSKLHLPVKEYKARLKARGGFILTDRTWNGVSAKCLHQCLSCGLEWEVFPYSLLSGQGCPRCAKNNANYARYRVKEHLLGQRIVRVQGYEPQALNWLVRRGVRPECISMNVPRIRYEDGERLHIPDFWIPHKNRIYEVKSKRTIGVWYEPLFEQLKAKRQAAVDQGYEYVVLLFSVDKKLALPKEWWKLTHAQFVKALK